MPCPNPVPNVPTDASFDSSACSGFVFGETCTLSCDSGFQLSSGSDPTFVCAADGTWQGSMTCERISCGSDISDLASDSTQTADCDPNLYEDTCSNVACNAGYELVPGTSQQHTCDDTGAWVSDFACQRKDCGSTISGLPSSVITSNCANSLYEDSCDVTCAPGYFLNSGSQTFTCDEDGQWSGSIECLPLDCGSTIDTLPLGAVASCSGNTAYGGDSCVATCRAGYTQDSGSGIFTCGTSGTWEGEITCTPVDCGATPQNLDENASADCSNSTVFEGEDCIAKCNRGYFIQMNTTNELTCGADGVWNTNLTCIPVPCDSDVPGLDPNATPKCGTKSEFGDECVATCDPGYVAVNGSGLFTCAADGSWNGFLSCEPIDCGPVVTDLPYDATSDCQGDTRYLGDSCVVSCKEGYEGVDALFSCTKQGQWAGNITCDRKLNWASRVLFVFMRSLDFFAARLQPTLMHHVSAVRFLFAF